jgi:hypothetical protein
MTTVPPQPRDPRALRIEVRAVRHRRARQRLALLRSLRSA